MIKLSQVATHFGVYANILEVTTLRSTTGQEERTITVEDFKQVLG